MATFNQVTFIGHVGKLADMPLQVTADGTPYLRFSLAIDQSKGQKPMWLNIVCWQELAERCEKLLFTGAQVFVQGRLQKRTYTDKNRIEREAYDIVASTIQLLEKKRPKEGEEDLPDEVLPDA